MEIQRTFDKPSGLWAWRTPDRMFSGCVLTGGTLEEGGEVVMELPPAALLAVPKNRRDFPSINKYSPVIVQAPSIEEVFKRLEAWTDEHRGVPLWDLRRD